MGRPSLAGFYHLPSSLDRQFISLRREPSAGEKISIATSGEYRNYIYDKTGNKITHTLNPITKKSIVNDSLSVTVISKKTAAHADALATAFNVMSIDNALELANSFEIAAMFIIQDADKLEFIYTDAWYYSANE